MRALPMLTLFAAIAAIPAFLHDPRDAAYEKPAHTVKAHHAPATALHTPYPKAIVSSLNLCGGYPSDLDFDRVMPGHPIHLHILCRGEIQKDLVIR